MRQAARRPPRLRGRRRRWEKWRDGGDVGGDGGYQTLPLCTVRLMPSNYPDTYGGSEITHFLDFKSFHEFAAPNDAIILKRISKFRHHQALTLTRMRPPLAL